MNRHLVKYVVVTPSGNWWTMEDSYAAARLIANRWPGTHVERWTYPVTPDGAHGTPTKVPITNEESQ